MQERRRKGRRADRLNGFISDEFWVCWTRTPFPNRPCCDWVSGHERGRPCQQAGKEGKGKAEHGEPGETGSRCGEEGPAGLSFWLRGSTGCTGKPRGKKDLLDSPGSGAVQVVQGSPGERRGLLDSPSGSRATQGSPGERKGLLDSPSGSSEVSLVKGLMQPLW